MLVLSHLFGDGGLLEPVRALDLVLEGGLDLGQVLDSRHIEDEEESGKETKQTIRFERQIVVSDKSKSKEH